MHKKTTTHADLAEQPFDPVEFTARDAVIELLKTGARALLWIALTLLAASLFNVAVAVSFVITGVPNDSSVSAGLVLCGLASAAGMGMCVLGRRAERLRAKTRT